MGHHSLQPRQSVDGLPTAPMHTKVNASLRAGSGATEVLESNRVNWGAPYASLPKVLRPRQGGSQEGVEIGATPSPDCAHTRPPSHRPTRTLHNSYNLYVPLCAA